MGKTVNANRFEKAAKELNKIVGGLASKISKTIKESDIFHYHVALVKVSDRPGQIKNKVTVSVQVYAKQGWEKIQKNFQFHGFNKIVLVHDPEKVKAAPPVQVPQHVVTAATAQAKNQSESAKQKEINDAVAKAKKQWIEDQKKEQDALAAAAKEVEVNDEEVVELTDEQKKELLSEEYATAMSGNKPELQAFLDKYAIPSGDLTNNEGRKKRITAWFEDQMKDEESDETDGGSSEEEE